MIRIHNIKLPLDHDEAQLTKAVCRKLRVKADAIREFTVFKRSVDARAEAMFLYIVQADVENEDMVLGKLSRERDVQKAPDLTYVYPDLPTHSRERPVIVGTGPCGLFAGLILAQLGQNPLIIERGKMAGPRARDVTKFWREGQTLDPESNVQFGEGGAGTFSDGKLYTQIKDKGNRARKVLEELAKHGAPDDILTKGRPHIGTDKLIKVVRNIREEIIRLGGELRFESTVTDLLIENERIRGLVLATGEELSTDRLILAVGHSARDTFEMLARKKIFMEAKPFSIGARIEHPQSLINSIRHGKFSGHSQLGSADYRYVNHGKQGRSAYSFCMCPGGLVVGATSEEGQVVTNGMSSYARAESNANSGFMVEVHPEDFKDTTNPLTGIEFQRKWERLAYQIGGKDYSAPAQLLGDLLAGRPSKERGSVEPSFRPGVVWCDLRECLPDYVIREIRTAAPRIDRQLKGFNLHDAVLTGVETRSSSPVRITRDKSLQSVSHKGLFPAGEGAGYAGGIISAAVDGVRAAEAILAV